MAKFNLTDQTELFKTKFGKLSENSYNSANPVLGTIKKTYDFTGKKYTEAVPNQFAGGVGSGVLPDASPASALNPELVAKRVYATTEIEREAIKASANDEGAFVKALKWNVEKTVEAFNRNASRIMFNDGSGLLGVTTAANATGTAVNPVIVIAAASWVEGHWEENDIINVNTDPSKFMIEEVIPATREIKLVRIDGTLDLTGVATAKSIYMQNSRNADPQGLKGVCDAVSGSTLYGVTVQRRFQATQINAGGSGVSSDVLNDLVSRIKYKCGKTPKLIATSHIQMRKIKNFLEDQKVYKVEPRASELKGKIGWNALEYVYDGQSIGIIEDRMCEDDRIYGINTDFIWSRHRPDFGWFDDDGTVFLRMPKDDAYEARYGGYYENYIVPAFQGVVTGLAK